MLTELRAYAVQFFVRGLPVTEAQPALSRIKIALVPGVHLLVCRIDKRYPSAVTKEVGMGNPVEKATADWVNLFTKTKTSRQRLIEAMLVVVALVAPGRSRKS